MSPEILELYVFIHYNWKYDFMQPSIEEIVKSYVKVYGREPREEDLTAGVDSEEDEEDEDEEKEEAEDEEDRNEGE